MTICSLRGFKKLMNEPDDLELENYLRQTIELNEVLVNADRGLMSTPEGVDINTELWKITTTYSAFKGRCHTIQYKKEVKNQKFCFYSFKL